MSDQIKSPATGPYSAAVEKDQTYFWCSCGKTQQQPFCDGSHKGTEMRPLAFKPEASKTVQLCGCKETRTPPFCDGSHKTISSPCRSSCQCPY